jgi:N-acetylneuraminate synthase
MDVVTIGTHSIGPDHPPYLIAEIGSNHNGDIALCRRLVDSAKAAGAHAVKFQSFSNGSLISKAEYARNTQYDDKKKHFGTLREMVDAYQFTPAMHREVAAYCREIGIDFLSTPFAQEEIDLLEELDVPAYKVASMDVNHPLLLRAVAATGKPVILSTGMASLGEISRALESLAEGGSGPVVLLHCVSIYPPDPDDIHLNNIPMLRETFGLPVGFSDHTLGTSVPLAAAALGACVIEKHFTLDKGMEGWDHAISADPAELALLARDLDLVRRALGSHTRSVSPAEQDKRLRFRRRAVLRRALRAGETLRLEDLDFKRPGTGIHPDEYPYVVGRVAARDLEQDAELEWSDLQ